MSQRLGSTPVIYYFDTKRWGWASRGGRISFLLKSCGQDYEDKVYGPDWSEWHKEAKVLIESGDNPSGKLPVVYHDGKALTESLAIVRRFARQLGCYGSDLERDYQSDVVADTVETASNHLSTAHWEPEAGAKTKYLDTQRPQHYRALEALVSRFGGGANGHAVGGSETSLADSVLFSYLWDDAVGFGEELRCSGDHPSLDAFFEAYRKATPAVAEWCNAALAAKAKTLAECGQRGKDGGDDGGAQVDEP